jgi:hypothetical protein
MDHQPINSSYQIQMKIKDIYNGPYNPTKETHQKDGDTYKG